MKKHADSSRVFLISLVLTFLILPILPTQSEDFDPIGIVRTPNAAAWGGLLSVKA